MSAHYRTSANATTDHHAETFVAAELAALAPRIAKSAQLDAQIAALKNQLQSTHVSAAGYAELAQLEQERADLAQVQARAASLTAELAGMRVSPSPKRRLPNLDAVSVAAPCSAKWDDMVGNDTARHCCECDKQVFNLSAMTRVEAETFLEAQLVAPCIRFYRRADGTLLTQDCPVGVKRRKRRRTFVAIGLALASIGGLKMFLLANAASQVTGGCDQRFRLSMMTHDGGVPDPTASALPSDDRLRNANPPEAESPHAQPDCTITSGVTRTAGQTCGLKPAAHK